MGVLIVIANTFKRFSKNPNLLPYDEFLSRLHHHDINTTELIGCRLIAGQGLDEIQINHAWSVGTSRGLHYEFAHWHTMRKKHHADKSLCHKHRPENILISIPELQYDGSYTADLYLHEHNELMLDHLTGQHIQGMVLTEACRQMFLAVTERYFLKDYPPTSRYFVINTMNIRFQKFAFPLPAQIRFHLIDKQQLKPDRFSIHADIDVLQDEQVVAGMEVKFNVFDETSLIQREDKLAAEAVNNYIDQIRREVVNQPKSLPVQSTTMAATITQTSKRAPEYRV